MPTPPLEQGSPLLYILPGGPPSTCQLILHAPLHLYQVGVQCETPDFGTVGRKCHPNVRSAGRGRMAGFTYSTSPLTWLCWRTGLGREIKINYSNNNGNGLNWVTRTSAEWWNLLKRDEEESCLQYHSLGKLSEMLKLHLLHLPHMSDISSQQKKKCVCLLCFYTFFGLFCEINVKLPLWTVLKMRVITQGHLVPLLKSVKPCMCD